MENLEINTKDYEKYLKENPDTSFVIDEEPQGSFKNSKEKMQDKNQKASISIVQKETSSQMNKDKVKTKEKQKIANCNSKNSKNTNKNKITDLIFVLDKSGSMSGLEKDTIGGFNSMLEKQRKASNDNKIFVSTILFDNTYSKIHSRVSISNVKPLTDKEYFVGGSTALFDAVGKAINEENNLIKTLPKNQKPSKIIMVITTDGYENSSIEFDYKSIKILIEKNKSNFWEFMFLGANIDSDAFASGIGISKNCISNYDASSQGTSMMYKAVSSCLCDMMEAKFETNNLKSYFNKK